MKRLIYLLLMTCLAGTAIGQQLQPAEANRENRLLTSRAWQAKYAFILPGNAVPIFPAYIPDSVKYKAMFVASGTNPSYPKGVYNYDPGTATWYRLAYAAEIPEVIGFKSGLTQTGDTVRLGGDLDDNTYFNTGTHEVGYFFNDGENIHEFHLRPNGVQATYDNATSTFHSYLGSGEAGFNSLVTKDTSTTRIQSDGDEIFLGKDNPHGQVAIHIGNTIQVDSKMHYSENYFSSAPILDTDIPDMGAVRKHLRDTLLTSFATKDTLNNFPLKDSVYNTYIPKNNTKIIAGDSTRRITLTAVGTSITKGPPNGVTYTDSTYVVKYGNLQGIKTINYGLSGRTLVQVTVGDSSAYSKRFLTPNYTPGSYIGCECGVNDAIKDSTIHANAIYNTQLTAWVDAQLSKGYPANHIVLIPAIAYFDPPGQPSSGHIESRHAQLLAEAQAVATAKGTLLYDGFATFKTLWLADTTILDAGKLHPTNTGMTIAANGLYNYLKNYIPTISDANPASYAAGSSETYWDITAGNDYKILKTPSLLLPNSTQPLLGYDATDKRVKTKVLYPIDMYNTIGATVTTGTLDFNDATNTKPGWGPNLLAGNTATNAPTTNSGSYHVYNIEYGPSKNGSGNITQFAYPYTTATSTTNGVWFRTRASGVWSAWRHLVASTTLGTAGQSPVVSSGGDVVYTTPTGTGTPVFGTAPTLTNPIVGTQLVTDNSAKAASTANVMSHFLTATGILDFTSTAAQTSSELTITVTGASDGDVVSVGVPNASSNANACFTARVSAPNTVTVKLNNYSAGPIDPVSGTFKVTVFK